MKKGGYIVLDFKKIPLSVSTENPPVFPGIYNVVKDSKKPLLLDNLDFDDDVEGQIYFYSNETLNGVWGYLCNDEGTSVQVIKCPVISQESVYTSILITPDDEVFIGDI